jgi:hypothetical protein
MTRPPGKLPPLSANTTPKRGRKPKSNTTNATHVISTKPGRRFKHDRGFGHVRRSGGFKKGNPGRWGSVAAPDTAAAAATPTSLDDDDVEVTRPAKKLKSNTKRALLQVSRNCDCHTVT